MGEERPGTRERRIALAYDFLAEHGPSADRDALTLAGAAKATGAARSQFYGYWETSRTFVEDITAHQATGPAAWLNQLSAAPPWTPLRDALRASLRADAPDALLRSTVSVRPASARARAQVAAWERDRLIDLADRLRREHGGDPEVPWADVAISIAAVVEGALLFRPLLVSSSEPTFDDDLIELTVETAARVAPYLAATARSTGGPLAAAPEAPDARERPDGARRLLERTARALDEGVLRRHASDRRLIDMDALARSLGVTSRSLYFAWPTAADLNADLFRECLRRLLLAIGATTMDVFAASTAGDFNHFTPLLLKSHERALDVNRFPDSRMALSTIEVIGSPDGTERLSGVLKSAFADGQVMAAAVLQASKRRMLEGINLSGHAMLTIATHLGAWRLGAMHDGLMDRRVDYLGEHVVALAAGVDANTKVWTVAEDDAPPHARSEPPLPDDLARS